LCSSHFPIIVVPIHLGDSSPIINWGKYREENGRLMMPVSVRLNHAVADGFLIANVFRLLEKEISQFTGDSHKKI